MTISDNDIDEVLIMNNGTNDYYYAHDHLYSPVALFESDGDVAERYEYNAYGKVTIYNDNCSSERTSSLFANPYYFTGRRLDKLDWNSSTSKYDLEIMYYRNRYYDPATGRFMQHDLINYADSMNLYEYVKSSPLIYFDPYGNFADPWSRAACGAAARGMTAKEIVEWLIFLGATEEAARLTVKNSSCNITITLPAPQKDPVRPPSQKPDPPEEMPRVWPWPIELGRRDPFPTPDPGPFPTPEPIIPKPNPNCGKKCLPCKPPVGTIMYRVDFVPPSKPHFPFSGDHTHTFIVNQSPPSAGCKCFAVKSAVFQGVALIGLPIEYGISGGGIAP